MCKSVPPLSSPPTHTHPRSLPTCVSFTSYIHLRRERESNLYWDITPIQDQNCDSFDGFLSQTMLTEIEHKVASLLELCRDQGLADSGAVHQEAEALALKLKTVKCNLEKVQLMLQEKYSEDQVRCGCA